MSYPVYNTSILNNVLSMVNIYSFIHSEDAKEGFVKMTSDEFNLDFAEMSKQEAEMVATLINTSDMLLFAFQMQPSIKMTIPVEIMLGIDNIHQKLKPFEEYVKGIATGSMTNAEAEHKLLVWGCNKLNDDYLLKLSESL